MRTVRTVAALRDHVRAARAAGRTVGLVPTMGALHDGHLSLIARAAADHDEVVVSLFVNPTQFNDAGDLDAYPRTEREDARLAAAAGGTLLFAPPVAEVYPDGFSAEVRIGGPLTERLEGAHRGAAHFHGVTTVVTKLLNMVQPDVAFFGAKDAQQVLVVQRLVRDLDIPVRIAVGATVREPDGLARSSRNLRLSADDRRRAAALPRALDAALVGLADGERDGDRLRAAVGERLADAGLVPEYVALVDPATLDERIAVDAPSLLAIAVPVGPVRLIDNVLLDPDRPAPPLTGDGERALLPTHAPKG
ncbi:pantoate--beta-alanine ligase [Patulibacter defluvii]|uniref:pantoate--beta-alanine ligase n=1 Tax=Patulibacter defluvii TaxID=3095358 RepID=UPI002A757047|nr:pantoate--beta-alanine ligase [Patulibacter sp. DM4]